MTTPQPLPFLSRSSPLANGTIVTPRFVLRALALAALVIGCGRTEGTAGGGDVGGTLIAATPGDPSSLLPPFVTDAAGRAITDQLYDRLAELPLDMNTVGDKGFAPRLADHWTWSKDSLSIEFHLDPRARWHDGVPVRAADVRFSHQIYSNPKTGSAVTPLISNIDSVSAKDSLTAVVWFKKHQPSEFYDFVYQEPILAEHVLKGVPVEQLRTSDIARHPIGTGRFRFVRWDAGTRVEIVADTANFRGRAKLDRVIWSIVPDFGAGMTQLLSGQADLFENVPPDQVAKVDSSASVHTVAVRTLGYGFMAFNFRDPKNQAQPHPILADRRVRRALSMAVDRQGMLRNIFASVGRLGHGPYATGFSGGADSALKELPYDTVAARALLDSAGWKEPSPGAVRMRAGKPLRLSILVPVSSKIRMTYAVLLQNQLRKVGVQVDLDQQQFNSVLSRMEAHDFDATINTWSPDPGLSNLEQNWSSRGMAKGGSNIGSYSNPTFDALVDSAVASFDPTKAIAYEHRAYQVALDDAPAIWLYDFVVPVGLHRRITTAAMRPDEMWWPNLADWSIPADKRIDRDRIGLAAGKK